MSVVIHQKPCFRTSLDKISYVFLEGWGVSLDDLKKFTNPVQFLTSRVPLGQQQTQEFPIVCHSHVTNIIVYYSAHTRIHAMLSSTVPHSLSLSGTVPHSLSFPGTVPHSLLLSGTVTHSLLMSGTVRYINKLGDSIINDNKSINLKFTYLFDV